MTSLFDSLLSNNVEGVEKAKESIIELNGEGIIHFFLEIPIDLFKNKQESASILIKVIINDSLDKIKDYFASIQEELFFAFYNQFFQYVFIESKGIFNFSPYSLLISILFISQPKLVANYSDKLEPHLLNDDEETIIPRLNILINFLQIIENEKLKITQRIKKTLFNQDLNSIFIYFKMNSINVITNSSEPNELSIFCTIFLTELINTFRYIFKPEEFIQIFDSLPNILPHSNNFLYDKVYSLLTTIILSTYEENFFIELSFPDKIFYAFENGLTTQNSFLISTLKFWFDISEYEYNLCQENERLHSDYYEKYSKNCHFLSTTLLQTFISNFHNCLDNLISLDETYYFMQPFYNSINISEIDLFNGIHEFIDLLFQNENTINLALSFISFLPRNELTFSFIMNFKDQIMNFISSKHESDDSLQNSVRIMNSFPELISTHEDCQFILQSLVINQDNFASQLLVAFLQCFSSEDPESIITSYIDSLLQFAFSNLKSDDRYPVICALVEHIPKHCSDVLYYILSTMLSSGIDSLAGCNEIINYLEFNEEQSHQLLNDLFSLDHGLLINEDGILAVSAAIKKTSNISEEELEIINQFIHISLDNVEEVGPSISILISSIFLKFGDKVSQLSENCFYHITSILDSSEFINSRFLKACADIIQSIGPIQEARETFINLINRCEIISDNIQNIAYSLMVLASTYFKENIEEQDSYIELLVHFLKTIQEQFIDEDAFQQICKMLNIFSMYMTSKQAKLLLRGNTLSVIKNQIKYKQFHDISAGVLEKIKSL